jgi:hypothetical protein
MWRKEEGLQIRGLIAVARSTPPRVTHDAKPGSGVFDKEPANREQTVGQVLSGVDSDQPAAETE